MKEILVNELMTRGTVTCNPDMTLDEVARILSDADISAVVVVNQDGALLGLISQFDMLKYFGIDLQTITAKEIMSKTPIHVQPNTDVKNATNIMREKHIHRLIVTNEDATRAVGVLSISDVIRSIRGLSDID